MKKRAEPLQGACLCGACTFTAVLTDEGAGACHCGQCRHWTGGIFIAVDCGASVVFDPGCPVGTYRASEWAERVFCKDCGSSLIYQMQDGTGQGVSIHCFDNPGQFSIKREWFIDCKPANYALAGETEQFTQAQCLAMFAPEGE